MSDERSLTEFSSTDSTASGDGDESSVEPATVTYRWQSDGAVCGQCGASTETQWLDDAQFVCPDCKSWA
jgi:NADH pyrophosphatase NudC (nudix superfamily)